MRRWFPTQLCPDSDELGIRVHISKRAKVALNKAVVSGPAYSQRQVEGPLDARQQEGTESMARRDWENIPSLVQAFQSSPTVKSYVALFNAAIDGCGEANDGSWWGPIALLVVLRQVAEDNYIFRALVADIVRREGECVIVNTLMGADNHRWWKRYPARAFAIA
jgi:hypothetical protein